jgi:hypothetical protein
MKRFDATVIAVRPDRFVAATDVTGLDVPAARGNLGPTKTAPTPTTTLTAPTPTRS